MIIFRKFLLSFFITISFLCSLSAQPLSSDLCLWYQQPASNWNEALPIGNGRIGAMVFGGPQTVRLALNEETIWSGGPNNNTNPAIARVLPKIRQLFFAGKYRETETLAIDSVVSPNNGMNYQPAGNFWIHFLDSTKVKNYKRDLNLKTAVASVSYTKNGCTYHQEYFCSAPSQLLVMRVWADSPGRVSCKLRLDCPLRSRISVEGKNRLRLSGITDDHENQLGQVRFEEVIKPEIEGGVIVAGNNELRVDGADTLTVLISIATNFKDYHSLTIDAKIKADSILNKAENQNYRELKLDHIADYQNYFNRVSLNLGTTDQNEKPTDIRLQEFSKVKDPSLVSLFFQYGRYLLISCSRPGTQPANLQGIWNERVNPPWDSKYTTNINAEMNYWPAEETNLSEMHEPLLRMINELAVTGRETARELYHCRGWVEHHNTDIWRITGPVDKARSGLWPMGEAWLCEHLWEHFLFSADTAFLRKSYPVMKSASQFLADWLRPDPENGWLVIGPSVSPENNYLKGITVGAGTTMDNELCLDLFSHLIQAGSILHTDKQWCDSLNLLRSQLAPFQIGRYGQLQEWIKDWDRPDDHHRHVSHLYGLYPGDEISPFRTPRLCQAVKTVLVHRGDESTGWSMGWKINLWARLLDGDHVEKLIKDQLSPSWMPDYKKEKGGTYFNLLDAHPPFQIDGNFGCTAGIAELLLQSYDGSIFLLPALPSSWEKGNVSGLCARGNFEVSMDWTAHQLRKTIIYSEKGGLCRVRSRVPLKAVGFNLVEAKGANPNACFSVVTGKQPIYAKGVAKKAYVVPQTWVYDFRTAKGKAYTLLRKR